MPSRQQALKQAIDEFLQEIGGAETEQLLESVMAGCAVVAYADGKVVAEEKERMMSLIHRFAPLQAFDRAHLDHLFDITTHNFESDRHEGERKALIVVSRLRRSRRHAVMLLKICQAIASADGFVDPREWHALVRLCRSLDLKPTDYGLLDAPPFGQRAAS
jgi:tellurite resistance protein TerB